MSIVNRINLRKFRLAYNNLMRIDFELGRADYQFDTSTIYYGNLYICILCKNKLISKPLTSFVNIYLLQNDLSRILMSVLLFFPGSVKWLKLFRIINSHLSTIQFYAMRWMRCNEYFEVQGVDLWHENEYEKVITILQLLVHILLELLSVYINSRTTICRVVF